MWERLLGLGSHKALYLEIIQKFIGKTGVLEQLAIEVATYVRRCSVGVYPVKWSTFYHWFRGLGISLSKVTVQQIADFVFLQKKERKKGILSTLSAIREYRSVLNHI